MHLLVSAGLIVLAWLSTAAVPGSAPIAEPTLSDLAFMTGCWEGPFRSQSGDGVVEEHYSTPSENAILGTVRYLRAGRTIQYEFIAIRRDSSGIVMTPYPNGRRSEHDFRLTRVQGEMAVFEAPEHDFPKRISYRRSAAGSIEAWIDGGPDDPNRRSWEMSPAPCF